jgi:hypothetical protein
MGYVHRRGRVTTATRAFIDATLHWRRPDGG